MPKIEEKIKLNKEKINEILLSNNKIKDTMNEIKLQIEYLVKNPFVDSINTILNDINKKIHVINEDITKNNESLLNLLNDNDKNLFNNIIIKDYYTNNRKERKDELNIKLNKIKNNENIINRNINNGNNNTTNKRNLYENIKSKFILKKFSQI